MCRIIKVFLLLHVSIITAHTAIPGQYRENPSWGQGIVFQTFPENFDYNSIRCILKDHKGYMWFATSEGLVRFDGIHTYLYEHNDNDSSSLIHNEVNDIVEDSSGTLWIGTSKGLNRYNRELDNFVEVGKLDPNLSLLSTNYISDLHLDTAGRLWIATFSYGFHILNTQTNKLLNITHDPNHPENDFLNSVTRIAIQGKRVWLGTQNGLCLYEPKDTLFKIFRNIPGDPSSLSSNYIVSLTVNSLGELWAGTRGGGINLLKEVDGKFHFTYYGQKSRSTYFSNDVVLTAAEDFRSRMWFGTENGGLYRLDPKTGHLEVFRHEEGNNQSLISNSVWTLYFDREERLWIGTANKGINVIDSKFNKFESHRKNAVTPELSLTHNDVRCFAENEKGSIWIGTDGGGICLFDPITRRFTRQLFNTESNQILENNAVQSILYDYDNNLWIGLWAGGINRLNIINNQVKHYKLITNEGFEIRNIRVLFKDSHNAIWAGTAGKGLFLYNETRDRFEPVKFASSSGLLDERAFVTCMMEDSQGYLWVGVLNGFVTISRDSSGAIICRDNFPNENAEMQERKMVQVIHEDFKGRIWLGTFDHGLSLLDINRKEVEVFKKEDGLPSNTINGILEDSQGFLWITTNRGMARFHYDSMQITNFTREDGLNSNEFYPNSCLIDKTGQFYVGGENGFNTFYPKRIIKNEVIPYVELSELRIDNVLAGIGLKGSPLVKHISETEELKLTHKQSSFTVGFVALNYTRPRKNQFVYKLDGLDDQWIDAGNARSASYTHVPPGKYVFMVKGSNNDAIWNPVPRKLTIIISPPLWKTWWAYIFYFCFIMGLLILAIKVGQERIHIKNQLILEKMAKEKEHYINERNIQFFTNISHEFRTPLSLIIGPLESLINTAELGIRNQLKVIQRSANRLLHLTNNLMNFRKFEDGGVVLNVREGDIMSCLKEISEYFSVRVRRRKIKLMVESNVSECHGWFDVDKLETIFLNLLSNAIRFSNEGGSVKIVVNCHSYESEIVESLENEGAKLYQSRYLELKVIDHGVGIPAEYLHRIFEKFYTIDTPQNRKEKGIGIGLNLTKGLAELHHGHIRVKSNPGIETVFTVLIPIDREVYADHEVILQPDNEIEKSVIVAEFPGIHADSKAGANDDTDEKPEILIVEDNDELRAFLVRELGKNYHVKQADDGELGIDMAFNLVPDLIVADVVMPNISGFELCRTVKSDIRTSHIPVLLLTARNTVRDQIEGVETGADVYITKPFSMELLVKQINHLIDSRRKLYARFSQDVYLLPNALSENEMDQEFLQKSIDYIIQNISDESLSVEGLAALHSLNRSNVYRKIRALTGDSVLEFIRNIRLKQAVKLMDMNKYNIAEIAYQTGFTSPSYFTKMFKRKYGKKPSEYLQS